MSVSRWFPAFVLPMLLSVTPSLSAAVVGKAIEYPVGEVLCEGWHAYDDSVPGKRPAILIVHPWTGVSDNEKMRSEMLAGLGYNVFALDIYGKGIRPQPPASGKESGNAAIGYCFGGTGVLELARAGAKIDGIVSFHGGLGTPTPDDAKNIACGVLVLHGADDPFVPPAEVEAFHREMKNAEVAYEFVAYPGAVHAFTQKMAGDDPSKGAAYQAEADAKSWEAMKAAFAKWFAVP